MKNLVDVDTQCLLRWKLVEHMHGKDANAPKKEVTVEMFVEWERLRESLHACGLVLLPIENIRLSISSSIDEGGCFVG